MRKVELNMNENFKYQIIKKLTETNGNKKRASVKLDCTLRHINRLIAGYNAYGKEFFVHGNRGKKPVHSLTFDLKNQIIELYSSKYWDCNFRFFTELLIKHENINVSEDTIRKLLTENYLLSPKSHRITKKRIKKDLKQQKQEATSKKELAKIQANIVAIENIHPRQPRSLYFGEEIQLDASEHIWFGSSKTFLHIAIDDATSHILAAYFDYQETLNAYYNIFYQILTVYGIPYKFKTDGRTIFEYNRKKSPSEEEDTFTQFSYACHQLGTVIETSHVPEFKARVERVFDTFQSRLPVELRLADITSIEVANKFLAKYIKEFNEQFALCINDTKSVFEKQPDKEKINLTLAVIGTRTVDTGHSISINKKFYRFIASNNLPIYFHKGTKCSVIKSFDGNMYASVDEEIYALEEIPERMEVSENFETVEKRKSERIYLPKKMSHPWKRKSYEAFIAKQAHRMKEQAS